jgi:hypothetical protein
MKNFDELEKSHSQIPVHLKSEPGAAGLLSLSGQKTRAIISSKDLLNLRKDDNGWFELALSAPGNTEILLCNALSTKSVTHAFGPKKDHVEHIFSNVVILGYGKIDSSIKSVAFKLTGLHNFSTTNMLRDNMCIKRTKNLLTL